MCVKLTLQVGVNTVGPRPKSARGIYTAHQRQRRAPHSDAVPGMGVRRALRLLPYASREAPTLMSSTTTTASDQCESRLSRLTVAAHERCLMNNVLEINS